MAIMELLWTSFNAIISSKSLVLQLSDISQEFDGRHERQTKQTISAGTSYVFFASQAISIPSRATKTKKYNHKKSN
jgi:hypothetical protein